MASARKVISDFFMHSEILKTHIIEPLIPTVSTMCQEPMVTFNTRPSGLQKIQGIAKLNKVYDKNYVERQMNKTRMVLSRVYRPPPRPNTFKSTGSRFLFGSAANHSFSSLNTSGYFMKIHSLFCWKSRKQKTKKTLSISQCKKKGFCWIRPLIQIRTKSEWVLF